MVHGMICILDMICIVWYMCLDREVWKTTIQRRLLRKEPNPASGRCMRMTDAAKCVNTAQQNTAQHDTARYSRINTAQRNFTYSRKTKHSKVQQRDNKKIVF